MKQTITIKRVNNLKDMKPIDPVQVEAEVFGHLAVHLSIAPAVVGVLTSFTVSHIPTGMAIQREMSKREALDLIASIGHLNWDFSDPKEAAALRDEVMVAMGELI